VKVVIRLRWLLRPRQCRRIALVDARLLCSFISERSLYAVARLSVVCLSVCNVRAPYTCDVAAFLQPNLVSTQPVEIFGNFSTPFGTLAIHWHPRNMLRRSSQGNPSVGGGV